MPRSVLRDRQGDFRGGLNTASDEEALAPNELRRAENAVLDEYGAVKKRLGTRRLHTSAIGTGSPIQAGYAWLKGDGTQQLMVVENGTLYTGSYGLPMTWTAQVGALNSTLPTYPSMVAFRQVTASAEVVYISDGRSTGTTPTSLNKWDGTTLTTNIAGTPSDIQYLEVYNQRLFGVTGRDQSIWWSGINNGDSLGNGVSGGGQAIIRTFSDQNITGLATVGASLLIFHVSGISRFTGLTQDDIAISAGAQGLTSDVGAIFGRSIVNTPMGAFFLSDRGFYLATETSVTPISGKINDIVQTWDLNTHRIFGVHNRAQKEIWWYVRSGTASSPYTGVFRYNYALNAWTGPHTGGYTASSPATNTFVFFEAVNTQKLPIVLRGDQVGFISQCDAPDTARDDAPPTGSGGTTYSMVVKLRRMFFGDAITKKKLKWGYVQCNIGSSLQATVTWESPEDTGIYTIPNPAAAASAWGSGTWGTGTWGAGGSVALRFPVSGGGTYADVTFTDSGDSPSAWSLMELDGFDYGRRY